jgi:polyisoprenoid-binding protein YceI
MRYLSLLLLVPLLAVLGCPANDKPGRNVGGNGKPPATDGAPKPPGNEPAIVLNAPAAAALALTPENTKIEFVGTKPNGKHEGGFKAFSGGVELAGDAVSKVSVEIDANSLYSDNPKLTGHLKSPDFFDVKTHPKAAFVSTNIKKEAGKDATHLITGDLTLHGETKAITLPAKIETAKDAVTVSSEFTIKRSDFGMTYGQGKVDDAGDDQGFGARAAEVGMSPLAA